MVSSHWLMFGVYSDNYYGDYERDNTAQLIDYTNTKH
jgi:hypothetical protein